MQWWSCSVLLPPNDGVPCEDWPRLQQWRWHIGPKEGVIIVDAGPSEGEGWFFLPYVWPFVIGQTDDPLCSCSIVCGIMRHSLETMQPCKWQHRNTFFVQIFREDARFLKSKIAQIFALTFIVDYPLKVNCPFINVRLFYPLSRPLSGRHFSPTCWRLLRVGMCGVWSFIFECCSL